tara:strand:+ start:191 stop:1096 length:906 start_codon:yes stop_codon:yes gene_type:complete
MAKGSPAKQKQTKEIAPKTKNYPIIKTDKGLIEPKEIRSNTLKKKLPDAPKVRTIPREEYYDKSPGKITPLNQNAGDILKSIQGGNSSFEDAVSASIAKQQTTGAVGMIGGLLGGSGGVPEGKPRAPQGDAFGVAAAAGKARSRARNIGNNNSDVRDRSQMYADARSEPMDLGPFAGRKARSMDMQSIYDGYESAEAERNRGPQKFLNTGYGSADSGGAGMNEAQSTAVSNRMQAYNVAFGNNDYQHMAATGVQNTSAYDGGSSTTQLSPYEDLRGPSQSTNASFGSLFANKSALMFKYKK